MESQTFSNVEYSEIKGIIDGLRDAFGRGGTKALDWRIQQLKCIIRLVKEQDELIREVLKADLAKSDYITTMELAPIIDETEEVIDNLSTWMKPVSKATALLVKPSTAYVVPEPLGVVLIIGAWNFPFELIFRPLIGALAAGNCVVLKPSEIAVASAKFLEEYIPKYFDPECIQIITGGPQTTTHLLENKFDHIFYTGSTSVGKIIMTAAAKHLTPVTLELGGKSPVIVCQDADIDLAARRIVSAKMLNAGQVCIAPDYVLVDSSVVDKFTSVSQKMIKDFFGEDPELSPDFQRIINYRHVERLRGLLEGQNILVGGNFHDRYLSPTIVINPDPESKLMQEEIFGPILPIIPYESLNEAIQLINSKPKPLALYLFTSGSANRKTIIDNTSSGGVVINDLLIHFINPSLPFGGVGDSGV